MFNLSSSLKDNGTNSTNYLVISRPEFKKICTLLTKSCLVIPFYLLSSRIPFYKGHILIICYLGKQIPFRKYEYPVTFQSIERAENPLSFCFYS